ncbi:hypothetical protein BS47DRAFT_1345836 [Hydnum rufescens UP504]|uniref:Uncharacterized protein n=1 Tax=Hydnum rufescens UP504 TaxID=1448309 RepID=A0A9P6DV17_9AGAM|nr:hypothetical protein BS47DRAFT_1345836 [Hydnum rufescens UP504]
MEKEHRLGRWKMHGSKSTLAGCRASTIGKQLGRMRRSLQCLLSSHGFEDHEKEDTRSRP